MRRRAAVAVVVVVLAAACERAPSTGSDGSVDPATGDVRHVVLDTDLAFDDVMALLYLLRRDDVILDAVTIAGTGEVHCDPGVQNARALLTLGGSPDTPVACGRETPLAGTNAFPDEWREASDDLSGIDLPVPAGEPDQRDAVDLLLEMLGGDAALLTLGPLTNVAEALRRDPGLAERVPTFFAMAGAIDVDGNAPDGESEYNVWADPLAAAEVVDGMAPTLVPLDATNDVPFTPFFAQTLDEHRTTPEAEAVAAMIAENEAIVAGSGYSFWDTLATALLLEPDLATWNEASIEVDPSGVGGGQTNRLAGGRRVRFAGGVPDPLEFEREYLSTLTGERIEQVRPDPSISVTFDGATCRVSAETLGAGTQIVSFATEGGPGSTAVVVQLSDRLTYEELVAWLGPPGAKLPEERRPAPLKAVGWVEGGIGQAQVVEGTIVVACLDEADTRHPRVWLSSPIDVGD